MRPHLDRDLDRDLDPREYGSSTPMRSRHEVGSRQGASTFGCTSKQDVR